MCSLQPVDLHVAPVAGHGLRIVPTVHLRAVPRPRLILSRPTPACASSVPNVCRNAFHRIRSAVIRGHASSSYSNGTRARAPHWHRRAGQGTVRPWGSLSRTAGRRFHSGSASGTTRGRAGFSGGVTLPGGVVALRWAEGEATAKCSRRTGYWWARQDSDLQPTDYESAALPLSYGPRTRRIYPCPYAESKRLGQAAVRAPVGGRAAHPCERNVTAGRRLAGGPVRRCCHSGGTQTVHGS
jgi:hypothetical protein